MSRPNIKNASSWDRGVSWDGRHISFIKAITESDSGVASARLKTPVEAKYFRWKCRYILKETRASEEISISIKDNLVFGWFREMHGGSMKPTDEIKYLALHPSNIVIDEDFQDKLSTKEKKDIVLKSLHSFQMGANGHASKVGGALNKDEMMKEWISLSPEMRETMKDIWIKDGILSSEDFIQAEELVEEGIYSIGPSDVQMGEREKK